MTHQWTSDSPDSKRFAINSTGLFLDCQTCRDGFALHQVSSFNEERCDTSFFIPISTNTCLEGKEIEVVGVKGAFLSAAVALAVHKAVSLAVDDFHPNVR